MNIRKTTEADVPRLMEIFDAARAFMRRSGNATQWSGGYPSADVIAADIRRGASHVVIGDSGCIVGTFAFIIGVDPTYAAIDGAWPDDAPYGTIHRIASDGSARGVADACLAYCRTLIATIRIDTHADNHPMLAWIRRSGFRYCGVIRLADGAPRLAFQL